MNIGFFIGDVINESNFKFIINQKEKHKSKLELEIKLLDGNIITAIGYDEKADYLLRKDFLEKRVFVQGKLINDKKKTKIVINFIKLI